MTKFWQKIPKPLAKFLGFMLIWTILANLIVVLTPPDYHKPNEFFNVCVMEQNKPKTVIIKELPHSPIFCQQPYHHVEGNQPWFYFSLKSIDNQWEITQYNDSMADPFVYRYRIENNQIIPLWYHYGSGFLLHFSAWLFALFATMVIHAILNRVIQRKNKQKTIT